MAPRQLLIALLLLATASPAAAEEAAFIIVNPAGRGNQSQAQGFLADFARALCASWPKEAGACPEWTGHYHVHQGDALASIRGRRPVIGLLSPGFYLATRSELRAEPRLAPVLPEGGAESVRLIAREGSSASRLLAGGSVEGLRIGGQAAGEPAWTRRVLLAGLAGADSVELIPHERTLRAVRGLRKGEVDAALLLEDEWRRLGETGLADGLVSARTVEGLRSGPLCLLDAPEGRRRELAEAAVAAVAAFPTTEAGRSVLATMGLEGFAEVSEDDYHRLSSLYDGAPPSP